MCRIIYYYLLFWPVQEDWGLGLWSNVAGNDGINRPRPFIFPLKFIVLSCSFLVDSALGF